MTAQELTAHPLFQICTDIQKTCLLRYLQTRDLYTSIAETYKTRSVSAVAKKFQDNDGIAALLYIIEGKSSPDKMDVVNKLWHTLKGASKPHEVCRLTEILSDLMDWGVVTQPIDQSEERRQKAIKLDGGHVPVSKE
jgi:hypothetical protein